MSWLNNVVLLCLARAITSRVPTPLLGSACLCMQLAGIIESWFAKEVFGSTGQTLVVQIFLAFLDADALSAASVCPAAIHRLSVFGRLRAEATTTPSQGHHKWPGVVRSDISHCQSILNQLAAAASGWAALISSHLLSTSIQTTLDLARPIPFAVSHTHQGPLGVESVIGFN